MKIFSSHFSLFLFISVNCLSVSLSHMWMHIEIEMIKVRHGSFDVCWLLHSFACRWSFARSSCNVSKLPRGGIIYINYIYINCFFSIIFIILLFQCRFPRTMHREIWQWKRLSVNCRMIVR